MITFITGQGCKVSCTFKKGLRSRVGIQNKGDIQHRNAIIVVLKKV